jgi:hypothetical protein
LDTYEVWHWEDKKQTRYNGKTGGLFAQYIDTFLRLKQQADGWPVWVQTNDDKQKYVDDYEKVEGIKLIDSQIEKNPGMRALAKLMLNSFWGKVISYFIF